MIFKLRGKHDFVTNKLTDFHRKNNVSPDHESGGGFGGGGGGDIKTHKFPCNFYFYSCKFEKFVLKFQFYDEVILTDRNCTNRITVRTYVD